MNDYQAFANEWSGEPQASEQLLQLTDRAIFAASDPKIPSEHLLGIIRELDQLWNSVANAMPTEVGNKVFAHLLLFGGHQWWRRMQSLYRPLLTAKINSQIQGGTLPDVAATNVVHRVCSGIIEDKKGVLDLRDLLKIIGCCVGVEEICDEITASG